MRKLLLWVCVLLLSATIQAQEKYQKATIQLANGASIECFIIRANTMGTPQKFSYVKQVGETSVTLSVPELQKVVFEDGTTYEKFAVDVPVLSESYLERKQSMYRLGTTRFQGEVMVEKVLTGAVVLYQFRDRYDFPHFFIQSSNSGFLALPFNSYVSEDNVYHKDNSFKNLLAFEAEKAGCSAELEKQMNVLEYNYSSMIRYFKKLNSCMGHTATPVGKNKEKSKIRLGLMGGVSYSKIHFKIPNHAYYPGLYQESFPGSINPVIGGFASLLPKKNVRNFMISVEVFYMSYNSTTDSIEANSYTRGKGHIRLSTLNFTPTIRFLISSRAIKPFIEGGVMTYNTLSKDDNYGYRESNTVYNRAIFMEKKTGANGLIGAGVEANRFSISARYQYPLAQSRLTILSLVARVNLMN